MRVYKFLSAFWAMDNLAKRRLKASDRDSLNDPFEFLAVDMTDDSYRKQVLDRVEYILTEKVLCCFSNAAICPLLWAHYSECHRGICLGFEISDSVASSMKQVTYVDKRYTPFQIKTNDRIVELLFTKFSKWKYEDEIRAFLPRKRSAVVGELTFVPFDEDLLLKEVILGYKCSATIAEVSANVLDYPFAVTVLRARPSLSEFKMDIATDCE